MALEERLLSRVRQNEIFECVQQLGLNPSEFKWDKAVPKGSSGYLASRLTHLPTGLYFTFGGKGEGRFWTEWWPPDNSGRSQDLLDSWVVQKNVAFRWLADVKQESEAPDLWGGSCCRSNSRVRRRDRFCEYSVRSG
jgi:hypothetical protein